MIKRVVAFSNPAYLSLSNGQLCAKHPAEPLTFATLPVEDLGVVILDNRQITVTNALMEALLLNNVAVITCGSNHHPLGLHMPLDGNTLQSERFAMQIAASRPLKKQLWQQTVQAKILNQAAVLHLRHKVETGNMLAWAKSVRSGDPDNFEARAAVYYWRNLFPEIENFSRDRWGDVPNNLLNYGYSIIRALTARALVASGLLPTLGIHHHNRYNAYCLADDIMEPYRPYVDLLVVDLMDEFSESQLTLDNREIKRRLLSLPVTDTYIDGTNRPLMNAVAESAVSLCLCYQGKRRKLSYPNIPEDVDE